MSGKKTRSTASHVEAKISRSPQDTCLRRCQASEAPVRVEKIFQEVGLGCNVPVGPLLHNKAPVRGVRDGCANLGPLKKYWLSIRLPNTAAKIDTTNRMLVSEMTYFYPWHFFCHLTGLKRGWRSATETYIPRVFVAWWFGWLVGIPNPRIQHKHRGYRKILQKGLTKWWFGRLVNFSPRPKLQKTGFPETRKCDE